MQPLIVLGAPGCGLGWCEKQLTLLGWPVRSSEVRRFHDGLLRDMGISDEWGMKLGGKEWWARNMWDGEAAKKAVESGKSGNFFGFADSRSVLFLDKWLGIYPDAAFVFMTRKPAFAYQCFISRQGAEKTSPSDYADLWLRSHLAVSAILGRRNLVLWDCDRISKEPMFAWEFFNKREFTGDFMGFKPVEAAEFLMSLEGIWQKNHSAHSDTILSTACSNMWKMLSGRIVRS